MDTHSSNGIADDPQGRRNQLFTMMSLRRVSFLTRVCRLLLSTWIVCSIRIPIQ